METSDIYITMYKKKKRRRMRRRRFYYDMLELKNYYSLHVLQKSWEENNLGATSSVFKTKNYFSIH